MIRILSTLFVVMQAGQLMAADLCDDYWFSRNLVFDQAGYCFASPLGQAVFDNSDCTTNAPELDEDALAFVAWVKDLEKLEMCQVNTARSTIHVPLIEVRRQIVDRVVASPFESACLGWFGERLALRAGHGREHAVIGEILPSMDIHWAFEYVSAPEGWTFVSVYQRNRNQYAIGWTNAFIDPNLCQNLAG